MAPNPAEKPVVVGRILAPWGVHGWLQVYSYTAPREGIFAYTPWWIDGSDEPVQIQNHKISGKRLVVQLPGIDTPEDARHWVDREISVARAQLPTLADGEFYWHDLVGCRVINHQQHALGVVQGVLATGANDVLEVAGEQTQHAVLIPFVMGEYIESVDLDAGQIVVDWPVEWLDD